MRFADERVLMLKRKRAKQTIQGATTRGERYNPEILRVQLLRGWRQVDGTSSPEVSRRTFWPCIILWTGNHQSLPLHDCYTSPVSDDSMHEYPRTFYYVTNAIGIGGSFALGRQDYRLKSSFLCVCVCIWWYTLFDVFSRYFSNSAKLK